jgi:isopenicillin-N N-acyltransferase like protein
MTHHDFARQICRTLAALGLISSFASTCIQAAEDRPFREARFEKGELKYINSLPVLVVEGTPQEIGRQQAALVGDVAKGIAEYPKRLVRLMGREDLWTRCVEKARAMVPQYPAAYREELEVFIQRGGVDRDMGLVGNSILDLRGAFACSSLIVEPKKSATGGPLFGRNLDFYSLGVLDKYSLVTVCRPKGKHAFASIGFPGMVGCLSGMNDAGLAIAVHEVFVTGDGSPLFNPKGVPYTLCFRRILEECTTIDEAQKLLHAAPRTTILSLAVCDRRGGAVIEVTPKTVAVRRGDHGICICTNHFLTKDLWVSRTCRRYDSLAQAADIKTLDLSDVAKKLDDVRMDQKTVQTMIFEPGPLVLHLAIGACPTTKLPLQRLPLADLLGKKP